MGVDLGELVRGREIELRELSGRAIAIDAYNALYQFLSSIRQPDGTPLMDRKGRITSHLSGLLYRTANVLEAGIKPLYVFDGEPHPLKLRTLALRTEIREKAREEWLRALERGDLETARIKAQEASRLAPEMVEDAKRLLDLMGVPWVQAPGEGEAQAAYMASKGLVWASASQDYDSLLFGTPRLVRNLTITGRRKLPRKNVYVEVKPELLELEEVLKDLGVSREQLVDMAILMGTDFNEGIKGVGPKTALKLIKTYGSAEAVLRARGWRIEGLEEVRKIFLEPRVEDVPRPEWRKPDEEGLKAFLCGERDFSESRVETALRKIRTFWQRTPQSTLEQWF